MNKAIILVLLLSLSTFAVVADNHGDDAMGAISGAISADNDNETDDFDDDVNIKIEDNETEMEVKVEDGEAEIDIRTDETGKRVRRKIDIEDVEVRERVREKVEDGELHQRIRQKVEAGFSEDARLRIRTKFSNISEEDKDELKEKLAEMKQDFLERKQEIRNEVKANREAAKVAVDALRVTGNFTGTDIAKIMQEYNSDLKEAIRSEEVIESRSKIARFFAGGDHKAAERLEVQIERNNQRIENVRLRLEEVGDEELKVELEEHLAALERNQERLQNVTESEKNSKGLFGWIWK